MPTRPVTLKMSSDEGPLLHKRRVATRSNGNESLPIKASRAKTARQQAMDEDDDIPLVPPPKRIKRTQKKNEKTHSDSSSNEAPRGRKTAAQPKKRAVRSKVVKVEVDEDDGTTAKVKLNFKEGQKHICPPTGDGTRAFYESLLKEVPNSVMANKYCIEHGILIGTQHKEQWLKYQQLRDLGAFRGSAGGVKVRFKDGISPEDLKAWETMRGINSKEKKVATPRKTETKRRRS